MTCKKFQFLKSSLHTIENMELNIDDNISIAHLAAVTIQMYYPRGFQIHANVCKTCVHSKYVWNPETFLN